MGRLEGGGIQQKEKGLMDMENSVAIKGGRRILRDEMVLEKYNLKNEKQKKGNCIFVKNEHSCKYTVNPAACNRPVTVTFRHCMAPV